VPRLAGPFFLALVCLCAVRAAAGVEEPIQLASAHVASGDYAQAIAVLEQRVERHNVTTLDLLCRAYRGRIRQMIESKRYRDARKLTQVLHRYEQQLRQASAREVAAASVPIAPAGRGEEVPSSTAPSGRNVRPPQRQVPMQPTASGTSQSDGWRPVGGRRRPRSQPATATKSPNAMDRPHPAAQPGRSDLRRAKELREHADAAFVGGDYARALKAYDMAYRANPKALDETAVRRWSYCRLKEAVELINRGPRNEAEWSLLEQEVREVIDLLEAQVGKRDDPLLRYGHFLLRVIRARQAPERKHPDMIRAAEPELQGSRTQRTRSPYPALQSRIIPLRSSGRPSDATSLAAERAFISRHPFLIRCSDPQLAAYLRRELPRIREQVAAQLFGSGPRPIWPAPCVVDVRAGANEGQERRATPPAITTVERKNGRIRSCRIELYRWTPGCAESVLAHEIAHVWLAAASPGRPLPPWADEGIAVLVEPRHQYHRHLRRLTHAPPLSLAMLEEPATTDVALFYAAAASFADYIRSEVGMAKLLELARRSATVGIRAAVREQLGQDQIEHRWRAHVAGQISQGRAGEGQPSSIVPEPAWRTARETSRRSN